MEYKFFTEEEANYISEMCNGTNTIRRNNFEKEFYNLHYDELVKGRRGEEWIKDAEKKKDLTDNQFLKIKVNALNYGIGCLNYFNDNDIDYRKDILKDIAGNFYKEDENYIKLLSYILFSKSSQRIDNIDTLDLFIDELTGILNYKDLRKSYIETYNFRKGVERKEKQDKEGKIKIDSVIDSIIKENKKYKLNEFVRDIFSEILEKQEKEGEIIYLNPESEIEIFNIWEKAIIRRVRFYTILNKEIKTYCTEKHLDYIMALYSIYIKNQYHYYCTYTNHKAYYDLDIKKSYFGRNYLMNFIRNRIKDKYIGEINSIPDIEDNIVNMFNTLDNNMDNQDGYFDITTAMEQNFKAFHCICIDSIVKFNSYTLLLENEIKKEIKKVNSQKQNKEYVNFENLIEKKEKKDSIIDEHEEIYKEIQKKLNKYISFDGVEKYKAIINYKINNKSFNNIDGRSYFVMKSNTKRDICKFAQCFNITLKEAEKIFKNIEKKNINLNPKDSVTINMTDPNDFEKALIEVRNKCLHKINPEKFKLLEK